MAPITSPAVFIKYCVERDSWSDNVTNTADHPPKELKTAILCGNAVILTFSPEYMPRTAPKTIVALISNLLSVAEKTRHEKMAKNIPTIPSKFPLTAVLGDDSILIETISKKDEPKYSKFGMNIIIFSP